MSAVSNKAKYIFYSILDFGLTFGGSGAIIIYNYITPTNTWGFKLSLSGIILVVALLFTAKVIFEKRYQSRHNTLLQQLAETTDQTLKAQLSKELEKHKTMNNVYNRLMILLPFAILYVVTWLGKSSLESLNGTVGLILLAMGAGSVFNILKKPIAEKASLDKIAKKAKGGR